MCLCLYVCVSVCVYVCMCVCLCLCVYLSAYSSDVIKYCQSLSSWFSVTVSAVIVIVCVSVCLFVCMSVCLSVSVVIRHYHLVLLITVEPVLSHCMYLSVCVLFCVSMYVCMFICVCSQPMSLLSHRPVPSVTVERVLCHSVLRRCHAVPAPTTKTSRRPHRQRPRRVQTRRRMKSQSATMPPCHRGRRWHQAE